MATGEAPTTTNTEKNLLSVCTTTTKVGFYALFSLTPLIFTPLTRELFEFPKMIFVYLATIIIVAAAFVKSILSQRLPLKRTPLDLPLGILLASYLLSTIASVNKYTSIFGYYTRFNGGLLSVLCFLALYYIFQKEFGGQLKKIKVFLKLLLFSSLFVSLYAVAQHLGVDRDLWVQDSQARAFATLGQPNWLAAYLVMILPLSLAMTFPSSKRQNPTARGYYLLTALFAYAGLWFAYSLSGLLGLIGSLSIFFIILGADTLAKNWRLLSFFLAVTALISFTQPGIFRPRLKSFFEQVRFPAPKVSAQENSPPRPSYRGDTLKIRLLVWKGALKLISSDPKTLFLGSGPETFAYAFLPFRPVGLNLTSEWDFLYNKAHNDYLDILATRGLLGLAAYLLLIFKFVFWVGKRLQAVGDRQSDKNGQDRLLLAALLSGWVGLLITNFFGWPVVATSFLFWLYPAVILAWAQK